MFQIIHCAGAQEEPTPTLPPKYNRLGGFSINTFKSHNIPHSLISSLVDSANRGISTNTQRSYKSAINHIKRVEDYSGKKLKFPFDISSTLTYIGYLLTVRKVGSSSVDKYLSGIRMHHLQRGFSSPCLRPDIVKLILTGKENGEQIEKRMNGKRGRIPVTPQIMRNIKSELKASGFPRSRKRTIWLCCTFCISAGFCIHEILSRDSRQFDPTSTLLHKDVTEASVTVDNTEYSILRVLIRHPKEERLSSGVIMELFEVKGEASWMCPVKAWRDWNRDKVVRSSNSKPAIRLADGSSYTGSQFNKDLTKVTNLAAKL